VKKGFSFVHGGDWGKLAEKKGKLGAREVIEATCEMREREKVSCI
jgi:hypothetical protein